MRNKLVIDASVFVSTFSVGERFHEESRAFLEKVVKDSTLIVVPVLTIFEILQTFYRNTNDLKLVNHVYRQLIDLNISKFLQISSLEADFLTHFSVNHQKFPLKTSDAVLALTAQRESCPLVSWDKQMLKVASKMIEAYTPSEWLNNFNS